MFRSHRRSSFARMENHLASSAQSHWAFAQYGILSERVAVGEKSRLHVRRERRWFTAGESPARELFAPPGSNRSGGEGNEAVGASGVEGRVGDSASMQAVTRVNAEQASIALGKVWSRGIRWRVCETSCFNRAGASPA